MKYLDTRLRYNYFRFRKTDGRHIGILLSILTLTYLSSSAWHLALAHQISSKSIYAQLSYDVISILRQQPRVEESPFGFTLTWLHSFENIEIYLHTKFWRDISIHGWDKTTSGFGNAQQPYRNSTSGFHIDLRVVIGMSFYICLPNFVVIGRSWRHIDFSRWRP